MQPICTLIPHSGGYTQRHSTEDLLLYLPFTCKVHTVAELALAPKFLSLLSLQIPPLCSSASIVQHLKCTLRFTNKTSTFVVPYHLIMLPVASGHIKEFLRTKPNATHLPALPHWAHPRTTETLIDMPFTGG